MDLEDVYPPKSANDLTTLLGQYPIAAEKGNDELQKLDHCIRSNGIARPCLLQLASCHAKRAHQEENESPSSGRATVYTNPSLLSHRKMGQAHRTQPRDLETAEAYARSQ